ncbi:MAG: hypothetical protein ACHBN1_00110 [Heteroscytonema crispum UTEX LB 1556]
MQQENLTKRLSDTDLDTGWMLTGERETAELVKALNIYKDYCGHSFSIGLKPLYLPDAITTLGTFLQNFIETLPAAWDLGLRNFPYFNLTPLETHLNQVGASRTPSFMRVDFTMVAGTPKIFEIEHNPGCLGLVTALQKAWGSELTLADVYRTYISNNPNFLLTKIDLDYQDARFFAHEVCGNADQVYLLNEFNQQLFKGDSIHVHRCFDPLLIESDTDSPLSIYSEVLLKAWEADYLSIEPHPTSLMSKLGLASIFSEPSIWERAGLNLELASSIIPEMRPISDFGEDIPERKQSVIKVVTPDQSYGSKGVKVGLYQRATKWLNFVHEIRANQTPAVVQRYVEHQKAVLPFIDEYSSTNQEEFDILYRAFFIKNNKTLVFGGGYYLGCITSSKCGKISGRSGVFGLVYC